MPTRTSSGFTLGHLLVVLVIIGVLIALAITALLRSWERARQARCRNNLKMIGFAALYHHDSQRHLPSGGWGEDWMADPDMGYGARQPGSWAYNLLPAMEQTAVHDYAIGQSGPEAEAWRGRVMTVPLSAFNCASRRGSEVYPNPDAGTVNADDPPEVARTDYAANGGTIPYKDGAYTITWHGARDLDDGDDPDKWPDWLDVMDGTTYLKSEVSRDMVTDGAAFTIAFGEKFMNPEHYLDGADPGDRRSLYHGYGPHNIRWTTKFGAVPGNPVTDDDPHHDALEKIGRLTPRRDSAGDPYGHLRFGSAHAGSAQFVFADGETRGISYEIDPYVFYQLCNRRDGDKVELGPPE